MSNDNTNKERFKEIFRSELDHDKYGYERSFLGNTFGSAVAGTVAGLLLTAAGAGITMNNPRDTNIVGKGSQVSSVIRVGNNEYAGIRTKGGSYEFYVQDASTNYRLVTNTQEAKAVTQEVIGALEGVRNSTVPGGVQSKTVVDASVLMRSWDDTGPFRDIHVDRSGLVPIPGNLFYPEASSFWRQAAANIGRTRADIVQDDLPPSTGVRAWDLAGKAGMPLGGLGGLALAFLCMVIPAYGSAKNKIAREEAASAPKNKKQGNDFKP